MSHSCADCGYEHDGPVVEPVIEIDPEPAADAAVRIAEIEADRDVTIAKVEARTAESDLAAQVAELQGVVAGMTATLAAMSPPEPEPTPVAVDEPPAPEPTVEPVTAEPPAPGEAAPPASRKRANPWW